MCLYACLVSLSISFLKFVHVVGCTNIFIVNSILLYKYNTNCSSILLLMITSVTNTILVMNRDAMNFLVYTFYRHIPSFILDIYLKMKLLSSSVGTFLTLQKIAK